MASDNDTDIIQFNADDITMNYYPLVTVKIGEKRFFIRYTRDDPWDIPWDCYAGPLPSQMFFILSLIAFIVACFVVFLLHTGMKRANAKKTERED
jgi:large-conductance mechanosensitive channel